MIRWRLRQSSQGIADSPDHAPHVFRPRFRPRYIQGFAPLDDYACVRTRRSVLHHGILIFTVQVLESLGLAPACLDHPKHVVRSRRPPNDPGGRLGVASHLQEFRPRSFSEAPFHTTTSVSSPASSRRHSHTRRKQPHRRLYCDNRSVRIMSDSLPVQEHRAQLKEPAHETPRLQRTRSARMRRRWHCPRRRLPHGRHAR